MNGRGPIHFRDLVPKDFYFIQILRNEEVSDTQLSLEILSRLLLDEESLEELSIFETQHTFDWAVKNLLVEKIMPPEVWLQTAFHLCKQRWDNSVDWLETQPVPKILLMIDILNDFVKSQEAELKKSSKR